VKITSTWHLLSKASRMKLLRTNKFITADHAGLKLYCSSIRVVLTEGRMSFSTSFSKSHSVRHKKNVILKRKFPRSPSGPAEYMFFNFTRPASISEILKEQLWSKSKYGWGRIVSLLMAEVEKPS